MSNFLGLEVWGVFNQVTGLPILLADAVASVEYQNSYRISDYPIEGGLFESYNKVKVPFNAKITYLVSGSVLKKGVFLRLLELAAEALTPFVIVTPEISYVNANIIDLNYRRTVRNGVQLIAVEVWCQEIRVVNVGSLFNTQSTNGASPQQNGAVRPDATGPSLPAGTGTSNSFDKSFLISPPQGP